MSWQRNLYDLFSAMVNQQSLEEAAEMMVSVSENDCEYHDFCVDTLKSAIQSCKSGSDESVALINKSGYKVDTVEKARVLLEDFLNIYLDEYKSTSE